MTQLSEIKVLTDRLPDVIVKLDKMLKRARKHNVDFTYHLGAEFTEKFEFSDGRKYDVSYTNIGIFGEIPRIPGFEIIGHVNFHEGDCIVTSLGDKKVDEKFRNTRNHCDHCGKDRKRNDLYIFEKENGKQLQIGRSCMKEYIGGDPATVFANFEFAKNFNNLGDGEFDGGGLYMCFPLRMIIATTYAAMRESGWKPSKSVDFPTYLRVQGSILASDPADACKMEDQDYDKADRLIEYVRNELVVENDYHHNMKVLFKNDIMYGFKHLAKIVSAWTLLAKATQKKENPYQDSKYLGNEGDKLFNLEGTVIHMMDVESYYGSSRMIKIADKDNNLLVWFSTAKVNVNVNDNVIVQRATVKRHSEYHGVKQTQVTRAKLVKVED